MELNSNFFVNNNNIPPLVSLSSPFEEDLLRTMVCRLHHCIYQHIYTCNMKKTAECFLEESTFYPSIKDTKLLSNLIEADTLFQSWRMFWFNKQSVQGKMLFPNFDKKSFTCKYPGCNREFTTYANMKRHEKEHSGEKNFVCNFEGCGKKFSRKYDLKIHYRIHTQEKPYACTFEGCGKKFSRNSVLMEHVRNVHLKSGKKKSKISEASLSSITNNNNLMPNSKNNQQENEVNRNSERKTNIENNELQGRNNNNDLEMDNQNSLQLPNTNYENYSSHSELTNGNEKPLHHHYPGCGHLLIMHDGHADFLIDSHLLHLHRGKFLEHTVKESHSNPIVCAPLPLPIHQFEHIHGPNCGHESIVHEDHIDYLVDNLLHHAHGGHCDNHGSLQILQERGELWNELIESLNCRSDSCEGMNNEETF